MEHKSCLNLLFSLKRCNLCWFDLSCRCLSPLTPRSNAWPVLGRPPSEHEGKFFTLLKGLHALLQLQAVVNFCYPDRVPLTQFVHIAKKILPCGPEFSAEFSVTFKKSLFRIGPLLPNFFIAHLWILVRCKTKAQLERCAPYCLMANYCTRWRGIFKGL